MTFHSFKTKLKCLKISLYPVWSVSYPPFLFLLYHFFFSWLLQSGHTSLMGHTCLSPALAYCVPHVWCALSPSPMFLIIVHLDNFSSSFRSHISWPNLREGYPHQLHFYIMPLLFLLTCQFIFLYNTHVVTYFSRHLLNLWVFHQGQELWVLWKECVCYAKWKFISDSIGKKGEGIEKVKGRRDILELFWYDYWHPYLSLLK